MKNTRYRFRFILICSIVCLNFNITYAAPGIFARSCQSVINLFKRTPNNFVGKEYIPPEYSHPSHIELVNKLKDVPGFTDKFPHLPELEQDLKIFKDTGGKHVEYFMDSNKLNSKGYSEFLENTAEILYFPHASYYGHIRLRIGKKMYGFENISYTFNSSFESSRIFKQTRALKKGKKAGNEGIVFVLTDEMKEYLEQNISEIENFYNTSKSYNLPPFDGSGATEIKVIVQDDGRLKFHSPTSKSAFGNRAFVNAKLEEIDGSEYLVAPNGFRHPVTYNKKNEKIVRGYSCASSATKVLNDFLGISSKDMPYAGSFLTQLKNGNLGFTQPDAVIHYYSSSDLD